MTKIFKGLEREDYDPERIHQITLEDISPRSKERIRKLKERYKDDPDFISLREDMKVLGQIVPIQLDIKLELVAGFRRYLVADDLNWKTISATIKEYTEEEKLDTQLSENLIRKNFTEYETYVGIAERKRLYDKKHPETVRGKYDRTRVDKKIINETVSFMDQSSDSFTELYARRYGLNRRTLEYKIQIGEAILNKTFHPKTIKEIEAGKLTQKQILNKLRQRQYSKEVSYNPEKRINKTIKKDKGDRVTNKASKIVEASKDDKEIKKICEKAIIGEMSVDAAYEQVDNIIKLKNAIRREPAFSFQQALSADKIKILKDQVKRSGVNQSIKDLYICKRCPNATVIHLDPNMKYGVLCDIDYKNGLKKIRDPHAPLCKNSPDYDLIRKDSLRK